MVNQTRKVRRGGGMFNTLRDTFRGTPNARQTALSTANAKRQQNLRGAKSRVANVLGTKGLAAASQGKVVYTNKERIEQEYQGKLKEIEEKYGEQIQSSAQQLFKKESIEKLKEFFSMFQGAIQRAKELRAPQVTLTIPTGLATAMIVILKIAVGLAIIFCGTIIGVMLIALGSEEPFGVLYFGVNLLTLNNENSKSRIQEYN